MKSIYAIVVVPVVAGALGACSHAHPSSSPDSQDPNQDISGPPGVAGPQPNFGTVVHRPEPPPPISGGTLAMAPDKKTAVASDPDRDRVYIVDLPQRALLHTVALPPHSEPGRVTVDDSGHAYVVLRRSGGLATIDLATGAVSVSDVCIAPRGVAWDKGQKAVHVACASGDLVTLPKGAGNSAPAKRALDRDLRDVVVSADGSLLVTTFRSASQINLWATGTRSTALAHDSASLAWRTVSVRARTPDEGCSGGGVGCSDAMATVVQRPTPEPVKPEPGGYGGASVDFSETSTCGPATGIITTQVQYEGGSINLPEAVLPVDLATNGRELAVVAAGNAYTHELPQIFVVFAADVRATQGGCVPTVHGNVPGQAVAAAFDGEDALIVQTREPAALHIMTGDRRRPYKTITLATDSVEDTGHAIFHSNAGGFIACASCHAEGADDGHVWNFVGIGPRRTPSLLATVANTEPFHWDGDMKDLRDLVDHVFVERMSGPKVDDTQMNALSGWLYALPEPPKLRAESEVTGRGAVTFQQRCASCHSGGMLTNNRSFDVGTGGSFQVPSLVGVGWRAAFIHTGCAHNLEDRFDPSCGGDQHGDSASLTKVQIQELVQFLETL